MKKIKSKSGLDIEVESSGNGLGNFSQILIDGVNHSQNYRGLNVVLIDSLNKIKSYNFDTFKYSYD